MADTNLYWDSNTSESVTVDSDINELYANSYNVLEDYEYRHPLTRELLVGTMAVNKAIEVPLNNGETYIIPKGYHTGNGTVVVPTLASVTIGNAVANDIAAGKIAYVNGTKVIGTLDIPTATQETTATSDDILAGTVAYLKGALVSGTMVNNPNASQSLAPGESYIIPKGYHSGTEKISTLSIAELTYNLGTAGVNNIQQGYTAWVAGSLITGSMVPLSTKVLDATANAIDIRKGRTAYIAIGAGEATVGAMPEYSNLEETALDAGESITVPTGYHDGNWVIKATNLITQTPGTATADYILKGYTAWVYGVKLTGTAIQTIATNTPATAVAADLADGKTAWSNGVKITGTNKYNSISFYEMEDNKANIENAISILLPYDNWAYLKYLDIDIFYAGQPSLDINTNTGMLEYTLGLFTFTLSDAGILSVSSTTTEQPKYSINDNGVLISDDSGTITNSFITSYHYEDIESGSDIDSSDFTINTAAGNPVITITSTNTGSHYLRVRASNFTLMT